MEKRGGILFAVISGVVRTMLRLKPTQCAVLVDKVPNMANIVAGAIVIGFAVGEPGLSWPVFIGGVTFWAGAIIFVLAIAEN